MENHRQASPSSHSPLRAASEDEARIETARAHDEWERRSQRRRSQRQRAPLPFWKRVRRVVLVGLVPIALGGGVVALMTSPKFAVQQVEISGLQITDSAAVEIIAQKLNGQNWLRADLKSAQEHIEQIPTIERATITRQWNHWPPRLTMHVEERRAWLRLGGGDNWFVADRNGVLFRRAQTSDSGLIAFTSTALDETKTIVGTRVTPEIWNGVRELASALDAQAQQGNAWQLRRAYLDRRGMASLRLQGGVHDEMLVRLGDSLWPQKLTRARQALTFFGTIGRRADALNLVSYTMPTWTPHVKAETTISPNAATNSAISTASQTSSGTDPNSDSSTQNLEADNRDSNPI